MQINDTLSEAYYHLALIDEKGQSWRMMSRNLTRAVTLNPDHYAARLKLAQFLILSGRLDKAQSEVDFVLRFSPNNLDAKVINGGILLRKKDYVAALSEANKVLVVDESHIEAITLKVMTYEGLQEVDSALDVVNRALQMRPDDLSLNLLSLKINMEIKDKAAIEKDYKRLIKIFPDNHQFAYLLVGYYVGEGREQDALKLLQDVVAQNKEDVGPKLILVDYLIEKNSSLAEVMLERFIQEAPSEASFYHKLAILKIQQKYC